MDNKLKVKLHRRITDVLTMHPGVSLGMMHVQLVSYGKQWREVFEEMQATGEVVRITAKYKGKFYYRFFLADDVPTQTDVEE